MNYFKMVKKHVNCYVIHLMSFTKTVYNYGNNIIQLVLYAENKSNNKCLFQLTQVDLYLYISYLIDYK